MLGREKKSKENFSNHTLIAKTASLTGDIEFSGGLHIQGTVEGKISTSGDGGHLVIGESGCVKGDIHVPRIVINGRVEGDVHSSEHLELAEKAVVQGSVYYTLIEMLMGSQVDGKLVREDRKHLPSPEDMKKGKSEKDK